MVRYHSALLSPNGWTKTATLEVRYVAVTDGCLPRLYMAEH